MGSAATNYSVMYSVSLIFELASHGAVCVELVSSDDSVRAWHRAAPVDERMAVLPLDCIQHASIGSSHMNQVLRNAIGRAVAANCSQATDAEGRLCLQRVEAHDSVLAEVCKYGLCWEVLSHTLQIEEPGGVLCIRTTLNDPANAMMVMHEMQIIKHLARVCMLESSTAGHIIRESVRARLVAEGFPVVDCAKLPRVLELCHCAGRWCPGSLLRNRWLSSTNC